MDNKNNLLRKIHVVDNMITNDLSGFISNLRYVDVCNYGFDEFFTMIIQWVCERMYYTYFSHIDDDSKEWSSIHKMIVKYLESVHLKTIEDFFNEKCN